MKGGSKSDSVSRVDSQRNATGPWDFSTAVLSLDAVFAAISHPRRRYLLYSLRSQTELTLQTFAEELADWEADHRDAGVDNDPRQVYVSLYHTHVPKLVEYDIVDFDDGTGVVTPGPNADSVLAALAGAGRGLDGAQQADVHELLEEKPGT